MDYLVDNCNSQLHLAISEKEFYSFLISLLRIKDNADIQIKILGMIEKWGKRFENEKTNLPNFSEVYYSLLKSGVTFPVNFKSSYSTYFYKQNTFKPSNNILISKMKPSNVNYFDGIDLDISANKFPKKFQIFVEELKTILENIVLANELINNSNHIQQVIDENVRLVISNLMDLSSSLVMAIQNSIDNDQLMELCLGINDDIQKTFSRYDMLKKGIKPKEFISIFFSDYSYLNLAIKNTTNNNIESISQNSNSVPQSQSNNEPKQNKYIKDLNDIFS